QRSSNRRNKCECGHNPKCDAVLLTFFVAIHFEFGSTIESTHWRFFKTRPANNPDTDKSSGTAGQPDRSPPTRHACGRMASERHQYAGRTENTIGFCHPKRCRCGGKCANRATRRYPARSREENG